MKKKTDYEKQTRQELREAYKAAWEFIKLEFPGTSLKLGEVSEKNWPDLAAMVAAHAADITFLEGRVQAFDNLKR